jgi:hypothetical protein
MKRRKTVEFILHPAAFILCPLRFWHGRRQVSGFDDGLKSLARVAAVAKWFISGKAAAAQRNHCAASQSKRVSSGVFDDDVIADHAQRAVVIANDCRIILIAHWFSPE